MPDAAERSNKKRAKTCLLDSTRKVSVNYIVRVVLMVVGGGEEGMTGSRWQ